MRLLILLVLLTGCSLNQGSHVTYHRVEMPAKIMWYCEFSDHWYSWNRTLAMCETMDECNEICKAANK